MFGYHGCYLRIDLARGSFEWVPLEESVLRRFLGGVGLAEIAEDVRTWHYAAFGDGTNHHQAKLNSPGFYKFRRKGEHHAFNPQVVRALRTASQYEDALNGRFREGYAEYRRYAELAHDRPPTAPRDLLDFTERRPIPADEVEPAESIVRRFSSASVSSASTVRSCR